MDTLYTSIKPGKVRLYVDGDGIFADIMNDIADAFQQLEDVEAVGNGDNDVQFDIFKEKSALIFGVSFEN